eukprot:TRINITY_DN11217_c0_g1_i6.p4 TRINITY_DN11217_c0_g1~~TRINITY_DN11217_c0_g1_i6.p4  ORF type:complete len:116 (-),score=9.81 TRINITY_DN11217_c0_g1_i6:23-370(-)
MLIYQIQDGKARKQKMNKNVSKVVALALTIGAFSAIAPATSKINLGTETVYASSKGKYLEDIKLETNKDKDVKVYTKSSYKSKYRIDKVDEDEICLLYTSPSPRDLSTSRMPSSA